MCLSLISAQAQAGQRQCSHHTFPSTQFFGILWPLPARTPGKSADGNKPPSDTLGSPVHHCSPTSTSPPRLCHRALIHQMWGQPTAAFPQPVTHPEFNPQQCLSALAWLHCWGCSSSSITVRSRVLAGLATASLTFPNRQCFVSRQNTHCQQLPGYQMPVWLPRHGRMRLGWAWVQELWTGVLGLPWGERADLCQPASSSLFWPKAHRCSLKSTLPSPTTGVHCSPGWASPPNTSHWSVQPASPRCLHRLKIKATVTPRVPAPASESISYYNAGPGLDSPLGLGEQTTATPQAQASLLKENVGGTKPRPQLHSSLEGLTHQQVGIQGGEAKTVTGR